MKLYDAVFNEESTQGVYGISLVESPAIMEEWVMLSEHPKEIKLAAIDDDIAKEEEVGDEQQMEAIQHARKGGNLFLTGKGM